jgi:hypothetical protein
MDLLRRQSICSGLDQVRLDKLIQITIKDLINITDLMTSAMVLYQAVGLKNIRTNLRTPGDFLFFSIFSVLFIVLAIPNKRCSTGWSKSILRATCLQTGRPAPNTIQFQPTSSGRFVSISSAGFLPTVLPGWCVTGAGTSICPKGQETVSNASLATVSRWRFRASCGECVPRATPGGWPRPQPTLWTMCCPEYRCVSGYWQCLNGFVGLCSATGKWPLGCWVG